MPATLTFPGVYIEELQSGVHTITGVATSITAFVGYTARGLDNRATEIFSFADFERSFGGLAADSELSFAVQQFYQNGGTNACVVRVPKSGAKAATMNLRDKVGGGADVLQITALSTGIWGNNLVIDVDYDGIPAADTKAFNLAITDPATGTVETFDNVTIDKAKSNFVEAVVNDEDSGSKMILVKALGATPNRPAESGTVGGDLALDADGKPTAISNAKNLTIKISSDLPTAPAISNISVPFLAQGDPVPTSVVGVCRLLERKINGALQAIIPGASVRCRRATTATGIAVRVLASIPKATDAVLTFAAGTPVDAKNDDADIALKLSTGTANVAHYWLSTGRAMPAFAEGTSTAGSEGNALPQAADLIGDPSAFTGIYALEKVDLLNILCIPDVTRAAAGNPAKSDLNLSDQNSIFSAAITYCDQRRAFLLIDPPPEVEDVSTAVDWKTSGLKVHDKNGAAYFPRLKLSDPTNNFQLRTFAPSGVVAGLYSRTDAARGVWKAPAGVEATLAGVQGMVYKLTDDENGALNPLGLNCFRIFPIYGSIAWGARTLVGSDAEGNEWKYVPVRRFALFLEESLYRGTKWVVFEPNDEPLWAQIRLNLGAFMQTLFRQGAFKGSTPRDAYFVKCDKETTTQNDIDLGIVNIVVGFAPLKPAEFVVIKLQQIAGQIAV
jgi:phage tail sheath protein FI